MAGGRPTTYSEEMLARTKEYIQECQDTIQDGKLKVNLPTVEGLSLYLGATRSTIYLWAEEHKEFSDTLDDLKAKQAQMLVSQGLANNYNSTIAKLMLSSNHGMREKSDITSDDKPIQANTVVFADYDQSEEG
jgi:hypothetical protein